MLSELGAAVSGAGVELVELCSGVGSAVELLLVLLTSTAFMVLGSTINKGFLSLLKVAVGCGVG